MSAVLCLFRLRATWDVAQKAAAAGRAPPLSPSRVSRPLSDPARPRPARHHLRALCFFASACWLWTAVSIWPMKVAQREKNSSGLSLASSAKYFLAASISDCISAVARCSSPTW